MSDARRAIFSAISRNKKKIAMRCGKITHTIPLHARPPDRQLQKLFEEKAIASSATIDHIGSLKELPDAVRRFLCDHRRRTAPQRLFINHPLLTPLDWATVNEASVDVSADPAFFDADVGITCAFCGIAETGSLVLLSETGVSSAAYFLPGVLIVALPKDQIVPVQETAWAKVQRAYSRLPRTVTLVTGPSRTGDIEQKLVIGAHGPREVHMVLI
ncbi:MAG TPA: lactate utilization protein [Gammaproteobacteria bacterium]